MRDGTRNRFLLCFRPVVNVDGGVQDTCNGKGIGRGNGKRQNLQEQQGEGGDLPVSENVAGNNSPARPRNRSLSRVLKAVMFESALTRRIRRRKASNRKLHSARTAEGPLPGPVGGGFDRQDIKELEETDGPPALSSSLPSESKCTGDEIVSGYGSETSRVTSHETKEPELVQGQGPADKRRPRRLVAAALSLLNHRGVHVFLTVVGVTVAWGKACAILFTSIWLYSIFFRRISRRRTYQGHGDRAWSIKEPSNIEEDIKDREGIKFLT